MTTIIVATAIVTPPCLALALLGWVGAARRARVLDEHLFSARQMLRAQDQQRAARGSAEIIPFPPRGAA